MGRNRTKPDTPEIEKQRKNQNFLNTAKYHIRNNTDRAEEFRELLQQKADEKAKRLPYRKTEKGKANSREYLRQWAKTPAGKAYRKKLRTPVQQRIQKLNGYNNRFKRMVEKDHTLANMTDKGLKYFEAILDDDTGQYTTEDKKFAASKILPYTSRALPQHIIHSGKVEHTNTLIESKIDDILALKDDSDVVSDQ